MKMNTLDNIRIVLVRTSHSGNIGAVARAMKNMSFRRLFLVAPKIFPHAEATARAAGADDILQNTIVVPSLKKALIECQLVIGTSVRKRFLPIELFEPKDIAKKIASEICLDHKIAIVFGTENSGLSNEELKLCQWHLQIPANPKFNSLNLAAAVLIVAYEINMALKKPLEKHLQVTTNARYELATFEELELFYEHLQETLLATKFLDAKNPRYLMQRLRRLFGRARLEKSELNILHGILTSVRKSR